MIDARIDAIVETAQLPLPEPDTMIETPEFPGYYVSAVFFLTGERRQYKTSSGTFDRIKPQQRLGSGEGSGAREVAERYSTTDLTDGPIIGGELDGQILGLNWYPNSATKMMFNYILSDVKDVGKFDAAVIRAQIDF